MPLGKLNCIRSLFFYSPTLYLLSYDREYSSLFFYNLICVWSPHSSNAAGINLSVQGFPHISQSCIKFLENVQRTRGWEWKYSLNLTSGHHLSMLAGITGMANTRNGKDLPLQLPQGPHLQYLSIGHTSRSFF